MKRFLSVMLGWYLFCGSAYVIGQSGSEKKKFDGPNKTNYYSSVIIDVNSVVGEDPKFVANPKPETFRVLKDFDGKLIILLIPGEANIGKTITITYADNKEKKTILETHTLEVAGGTPGPTPVPPAPDGVKSKYFDSLKAAYLVNPDATSLAKLTAAYKEAAGVTGLTTRNEAAGVLKVKVGAKLQQNDLRKVRDTVQSFLEKDLGTDDSLPFDPTTFKVFLTSVVGDLKLIGEGK